jgi:hypothetical protein
MKIGEIIAFIKAYHTYKDNLGTSFFFKKRSFFKVTCKRYLRLFKKKRKGGDILKRDCM